MKKKMNIELISNYDISFDLHYISYYFDYPNNSLNLNHWIMDWKLKMQKLSVILYHLKYELVTFCCHSFHNDYDEA